MTEIQALAIQWVLAALALYAAFAALNRLVRAVAAIVAAVLITGYVLNPGHPTTLLLSLWEAAREPALDLAQVLIRFGRLLWDHVLSLLAR